MISPIALRAAAAAVLLAGTSLTPAQALDPGPDYVLYGGKIVTSNTNQAYVEALVVKGERVGAVGTSQEMLALAGPATKRLDLGGRVAVPGFNDAHYHLFAPDPGFLMSFPSIDPTWDQVKAKLKSAVALAPKGSFIFGQVGAAVLEAREARRDTLDALAPGHAVVLRFWGGHFYILNSLALRMLGIREDQPDPVGGRWERSPKDGKLTGVALEYAAFRLHRRLSELATGPQTVQAVRDFADQAVRFGITTVQHMSMPLAPGRLVDFFEIAGVPIRSRVMRFLLTDEKGRNTSEGKHLPLKPSPLTTVSGTKWILDGGPVGRSCALRQPYADRPSTSGCMNITPQEMETMLEESLQDNDPLIVHSVGDRTTESFLNAMEKTGGSKVWATRRVRIEHGDGLAPDLMARARELGVVVVVNPTHFSPELGTVMARRVGAQRVKTWEPVRSVLAAGIPLAIGSDGPLNPYLNIRYASTYRQNPNEA